MGMTFVYLVSPNLNILHIKTRTWIQRLEIWSLKIGTWIWPFLKSIIGGSSSKIIADSKSKQQGYILCKILWFTLGKKLKRGKKNGGNCRRVGPLIRQGEDNRISKEGGEWSKCTNYTTAKKWLWEKMNDKCVCNRTCVVTWTTPSFMLATIRGRTWLTALPGSLFPLGTLYTR